MFYLHHLSINYLNCAYIAHLALEIASAEFIIVFVISWDLIFVKTAAAFWLKKVLAVPIMIHFRDV